MVFQRKWKILITRRMVGDILKRKTDWDATDTYQLKTKRAKKPKFEQLEHALGLWLATMEAKKATFTDAVLVAKLKEFASRLGIRDGDFKCSKGGLSRFKQRRGIASQKLHGEASSVDPVVCKLADMISGLCCQNIGPAMSTT